MSPRRCLILTALQSTTFNRKKILLHFKHEYPVNWKSFDCITEILIHAQQPYGNMATLSSNMSVLWHQLARRLRQSKITASKIIENEWYSRQPVTTMNWWKHYYTIEKLQSWNNCRTCDRGLNQPSICLVRLSSLFVLLQLNQYTEKAEICASKTVSTNRYIYRLVEWLNSFKWSSSFTSMFLFWVLIVGFYEGEHWAHSPRTW